VRYARLRLSCAISITHDTLNLLEDSLARFHDNKDVFIDLRVRVHFLIPKLHSMLHYKSSITLFGTTDNYNTEQSERLHIDLTKDAYGASNRKDEYPQMTTWLERREKTHTHAAFIRWRQLSDQEPPHNVVPIALPKAQTRYPKMTKHPTCKAVSFEDLAEQYGAVEFQDALADYIARINHPGASAATLRARASDTLIPFRTVPVFHRIKFTSTCNSDKSEIVDSVVIRPEQNDTRGRIVPPRFDTVLVHGAHQDAIHGNNGESYHILRLTYISSLLRSPDSATSCCVPITKEGHRRSLSRNERSNAPRIRRMVFTIVSNTGPQPPNV